MMIVVLNFIFLLFVLATVNIGYKGRTFDKTSWNRVTMLSAWFVICSLILLWVHYQKLLITLNFKTIGLFVTISLVWFLFPKLIRFYGTYPSLYLNDKKGNVRFIVRFEFPSMTIKYFEVLFQQATFMFLLFVALAGLSITKTVFLFILIVVIIHLGNLFFINRKWALFYTVLSVPMAIGFGYLILQGLVLLTASIHLVFYLVFNGRYWFEKKYSSS